MMFRFRSHLFGALLTAIFVASGPAYASGDERANNDSATLFRLGVAVGVQARRMIEPNVTPEAVNAYMTAPDRWRRDPGAAARAVSKCQEMFDGIGSVTTDIMTICVFGYVLIEESTGFPSQANNRTGVYIASGVVVGCSNGELVEPNEILAFGLVTHAFRLALSAGISLDRLSMVVMPEIVKNSWSIPGLTPREALTSVSCMLLAARFMSETFDRRP